MTPKIILGKAIAEEIQLELAQKIEAHRAKPHLAVILVGNHLPSHTYVEVKKRACQKVGIEMTLFKFDAQITQNELLEKIASLNNNPKVHGLLIQLPLPQHIDTHKVIEAIDPQKDVDGFHPLNMGKLLLGLEGGFIPCTPLGIQVLLQRSSIPVEGKHVVIVGRSNIVGKPLAALLMQKKPGSNATVTLAHSGTEALEALTFTADILVAAVGVPRFIKAPMVREGAVVIDVGIHREKGGLIGDVDFAAVAPKCHAISPVPGGVGPMTVAMLLHNTFHART